MINLAVLPYVPKSDRCCCESPPINLEKDWDLNVYLISLLIMIINSVIIIWYLNKQKKN